MKIFTMFIVLVFFSLQNNLFCIEPEIVWEKLIPFPEMSVNPWAFMNYSDNGILLWIEGKDTVANPKRMFRVFLLDKDGNLKIRKEYSRPEGIKASFSKAKIFLKSTNYEIIGTLSVSVPHASPLPIKKLRIDNECNVSGNLSDVENPERIDATAYPNFLFDSVYVGVFDFDTTIYNYLQSQLVYNSEAEFIRKLTFDTNGINEPIEMRFPQTDIFPCYDGNIIIKLSGPIDFSNYDSGETEYIFLCKYSLSGKLIWKCKIINKNSGYRRINIDNVYQLTNGSYNFIGYWRNINQTYSESQAIIGNISESGELNWMKTVDYISKSVYTTKQPVIIRDGDNFVIYRRLVITDSVPRANFWLMLVDKEGNKLDEYIWNSNSGENDNHIIDIAVTDDNNLIVLGMNGYHSIYLAEIKPKFTSGVKVVNSPVNWCDVKISPNPAKENVNINVVSQTQINNADCLITDNNGNIIKVFNMGNNYNLNTSELPQGTYILQLNIKDQNMKTKANLSQIFVIIK